VKVQASIEDYSVFVSAGVGARGTRTIYDTILTLAMKELIPWFIKIPAKIVLSRLPVGYRQWRRLNLFVAGPMDRPKYAFDVFKQHYEVAGFSTVPGRTVLELGPGDSLLTALYARSFGASRTWLIDVAPLASRNSTLFAQAEQMLTQLDLPVPGVGRMPSVSAVLQSLNATYLTEGLASLKTVPDGAVDLIFSQAVLEHVRLADFAKLVREMRRVLKPNGVASHEIDFRDHLQNGLNNLRFPGRIWESEFMVRSGFYTNRLRWPAMKGLFQEAGFSVKLRTVERWPNGLPTHQRSMALPFRTVPAEELMVKLAHVELRPVS
jgi:SAM-dependent methyltransferase